MIQERKSISLYLQYSVPLIPRLFFERKKRMKIETIQSSQIIFKRVFFTRLSQKTMEDIHRLSPRIGIRYYHRMTLSINGNEIIGGLTNRARCELRSFLEIFHHTGQLSYDERCNKFL